MGYLNRMYGKKNEEFVRGVLTGIYFHSDCIQGQEYFGTTRSLEEVLQEAIDDLAENPERFDAQSIIDQGYVKEVDLSTNKCWNGTKIPGSCFGCEEGSLCE